MESPMEERRRLPCHDFLCDAVVPILLATSALAILVIFYLHDSNIPSPPKLCIYDFTLSPKFAATAAAVNSNSTSASPPLTANCTITFAFDNNNVGDGKYYSRVDQYDEMEVSVVWAGQNQTLMRAHPGPFSQGSLEQKPVLLAATDSVVPSDLKSAAVYTFSIDLKSRVKEDPGDSHEDVFYIKATCEEVRIGFGSMEGIDRVARMLDGPQMCRVVQSKSSFNLGS
ncbi:unnamed protein product [Cuscuta epithymum]|uniref:Late embryogenesis abundant protein LEA-2 subgroup domain-containing protein n=1 Tax=Cuscuta epithymum TaxID=186058 RepID=A0AAV0FUX6_9ASTE|nr:unnamed protein product [Cuscuta epithymum]